MPASTFLPFTVRWLRRALLPVAAAAVLAGCGGGDRVAPFKPSRIYIFGDEYSSIDATTGVKYTVNVPNPSVSGTYYCADYPSWVQYLVNTHYRKELDICRVGLESTPSAVLQAQPGWKTADVLTALNATSFGTGDLVVVMIGTNDVTDSSQSDSDVASKAQQLGQRLRQLADNNIHVMVVLVPKIDEAPGLSGYASRRQSFNDTLRGLNGLGANVDGRRLALVQADALITDLKNSSYFTTTVLCPAAATSGTPTDCNDTAISGISSPNSYVWAWRNWLSPNTHTLLGQRAANQAASNWE